MSLRRSYLCLVLFLLQPFALPHRGDPGTGTKQLTPSYADLYARGKLFDQKEYKTVRACSARMFEKQHEDVIRVAYGDDFDQLNAWLTKNLDIKEAFYTALDERRDNVRLALLLFRDIWKKHTAILPKFADLAIATAVTWDDARKNLYDYRGHQVRTRSLLPKGYDDMTALEMFDFHVANDKLMRGNEPISRLQTLPWEFLVYVVDHKTPFDERRWAVRHYLAKRPLIGKIYKEIVYDKEMLRTQSKVCKLNGQPYTLESILEYGGVCAMQADFAARV